MVRRMIACAVGALLLTTLAGFAGPALAQDEEATQPQLERSEEQATTDARAIQDLYAKYKDAFDGVWGGVSVGETTPKATFALCEKEFPKLEALEADALPAIRPVLARVMELWCKPGAEEEARQDPKFDEADFAFQQCGDMEWSMKMAAADNDVVAARDLPEEFDHLSTRISDLVRMVNNVHKTRAANAAYLVSHVQDQPEITFFGEDVRVDIMHRWKTYLEWAVKFDPANEYANTRLASMDQEIADLEKSIEKAIDERAWAGQMQGFPGPGSVEALSKAALEWFRKDKDWGNKGDNPAKNKDGTVRQGADVLAAVVRGPWLPADRDIFGRIISWRLPIHLAITKPDLRAKNVARVYELSVVTVEGAPGHVAKAPPFDGYWVGNSWMIRLNKVPGAK